MIEHLPKEVREGLNQARRDTDRRKSKMRVEIGGQRFTILRYWNAGFTLDAADAPPLRGHVDVYDGARHMAHCLIVASGEENGERVYEFKQNTRVTATPPRDFAPEEFTPAGLLTSEN